MRNAGIVRNIDELGRIVVPKEMRRRLGIQNTDPVEIFADDEKIVIMKFSSRCVFCGKEEETIDFKGKKICPECIKELADPQGYQYTLL